MQAMEWYAEWNGSHGTRGYISLANLSFNFVFILVRSSAELHWSSSKERSYTLTSKWKSIPKLNLLKITIQYSISPIQHSRAAFNFGPMWIKCSLFFFCFLSSRIIELFLLHSCFSVPWPQESLILPPTYRKFSTIVDVSPTLAPLISCKPFLPEVPHFSKHPISTAVAGRWPDAVNLYASSPFRHWSHWMPGLCWIKLTTCVVSFWVGCTTIQESSLCKSHDLATQSTMNL